MGEIFGLLVLVAAASVYFAVQNDTGLIISIAFAIVFLGSFIGLGMLAFNPLVGVIILGVVSAIYWWLISDKKNDKK